MTLRKKIIVLCDGTWCGKETGTETNISIIGSMIGLDMTSAIKSTPSQTPISVDFADPSRQVVARYFDGIGTGGTFLEYIINGAIATTIGDECIAVYEYIVSHFDNDSEIWMFGFSRGSFTVRAVCGMINNCGIVKRLHNPEQTRAICKEVYEMYRSPYAEEEPHSVKMSEFRDRASWHVTHSNSTTRSPVKFMGIIDTVGALGVPKFNAGIGLEWPEFYDQVISSEVEKVWHAVAMHERLWILQPCHARRKLTDPSETIRPDLELHEKWFPGCHYDVANQHFRFLREGVNIVEKVLFKVPNLFTKTIVPNEVCSNLVLHWMLCAIRQDADDPLQIIPDLHDQIENVEHTLAGNYQDVGSGDVYNSVLDYAPGLGGPLTQVIARTGNALVRITDFWTPTLKLGTAIQGFLGFKTILQILTQTRDRRIASVGADVMILNKKVKLLGDVSPEQKAELNRKTNKYTSKTYRNFQTYRLAIHTISDDDFRELTEDT